jgi:hypothetical protein
MTRQRCATPLRQHRETFVEPCGEFAQAKLVDPRGGHFDCERNSVEEPADFGRKSIAEEKPETIALARKLARARPKGGRLSLREISAALAEAGHTTKTGSRYAATAIKLMLDAR